MPNEKIHNDGRLASDVGLNARQTTGRKDPDLEQRHRFARGPSQTPLESDRYGNVQAREMEEDRVAIEARQKIKETGDLTMADLMGGIEKQLGVAMDDAARNLLNENQTNPTPDEAALYANSYASDPPPRAASHDWTVQKFQAKLRSGKFVPVWKVFNEKTKMSMEKPFRIMEAAERIAAILNQSGDVNDRRIAGIMEAYDRHRQLMKQKRQLREAIQAGRKSLRPKLAEVQDELEQVNYKLGI